MPDPLDPAIPSKNPIRDASEIVDQHRAEQIAGERQGRTSVYTCPECGGTLWQVNEPELLLFRCHVGHILTGELLFAEQTQMSENSLWYTIRTLTDKIVLSQELAEYARQRGDSVLAGEYEVQGSQTQQKMLALKQIAERNYSP